jgi:hypothetical protein
MIIAAYFCPAPQEGGGESIAWIDSEVPDMLVISSMEAAGERVGPHSIATSQPPAHTWQTIYVHPEWSASPGRWPIRMEDT